MPLSAQKWLIASATVFLLGLVSSIGSCAYYTDRDTTAAKVECLKTHDPGECARLFASGSRS